MMCKKGTWIADPFSVRFYSILRFVVQLLKTNTKSLGLCFGIVKMKKKKRPKKVSEKLENCCSKDFYVVVDEIKRKSDV